MNQFRRHVHHLHWGGTPLHVAGPMGRLRPIQWLLDHGADPMITDLDGTLPCTTADLYYQDEAFGLLHDAYQRKSGGFRW